MKPIPCISEIIGLISLNEQICTYQDGRLVYIEAYILRVTFQYINFVMSCDCKLEYPLVLEAKIMINYQKGVLRHDFKLGTDVLFCPCL
jgi:hypothetical protein